MSEQVDHFDRSGEPADRWHPDHDSVTAWLDTEAPVTNETKLRNTGAGHYAPAGTVCKTCEQVIADE